MADNQALVIAQIAQGLLVNEGRPLTDMEYMMLEAELSTVGYRLVDSGHREGGYAKRPPSVMKSLGQIMTYLIGLRGGAWQWVPLFTDYEVADQQRIDTVRKFVELTLANYPYVPRDSLKDLATLLWDNEDHTPGEVLQLWHQALRMVEVNHKLLAWDLRRLRLVSEVKWKKEMAKLTADAHWMELQGRS